MTAPPPASTTRASALTSDTAPPTGRPRLATLEKIAGNTTPAPGTFSAVMTCISEVNKVRMRSSVKYWRTTLKRSCCAWASRSLASGPLSRSRSSAGGSGAL